MTLGASISSNSNKKTARVMEKPKLENRKWKLWLYAFSFIVYLPFTPSATGHLSSHMLLMWKGTKRTGSLNGAVAIIYRPNYEFQREKVGKIQFLCRLDTE